MYHSVVSRGNPPRGRSGVTIKREEESMNESDRTALRNILNKAYISPLVVDALVKTISANGFKRENVEGPPRVTDAQVAIVYDMINHTPDHWLDEEAVRDSLEEAQISYAEPSDEEIHEALDLYFELTQDEGMYSVDWMREILRLNRGLS